MENQERISSFKEFYPYYLDEHRKTGTRVTHFIGTSLFLYFIFMLIFTGNGWNLLYGALCGYGFAWIGHFFIEKNKPATFKYPVWSLASDFVLYFEILIGRQSIRSK